eukprot:1011495-Prymnesium_polylepis.1
MLYYHELQILHCEPRCERDARGEGFAGKIVLSSDAEVPSAVNTQSKSMPPLSPLDETVADLMASCTDNTIDYLIGADADAFKRLQALLRAQSKPLLLREQMKPSMAV